MEKRRYKNSNDYISLLGFGCMRLPQTAEKKIDEKAAEEMVDAAMNAGVNYFDTAYIYHNGESEKFLGRALKKYRRESFYLADKMPPWNVRKAADVERVFEEQLRRCGVEYFDFYLIHNASRETIPTIEKYDFYDFLKLKKEEGKIRRLGFSAHDRASFLKSYTEKYEFDFAQIQLNYLDWEQQDAEGQYNVLAEKGLPVIVMEPLRGGALARLNKNALDILKAADSEASAASWGLRYAASKPAVLTVLSGMSEIGQLTDNIHTFKNFRPLDEDEYRVLEGALKEFRASRPVPCTACRYCSDCPAGVDIARNFGVYNAYLAEKSAFAFESGYALIDETNRAHLCIECGKCMEHCPQKIKIPEILKKVAALDKRK
ncbi:MAG: aldo/keto reductase [Christensenellales bacterium]|jgi:predicted aldo/keto reductase-like oxidoreductase